MELGEDRVLKEYNVTEPLSKASFFSGETDFFGLEMICTLGDPQVLIGC